MKFPICYLWSVCANRKELILGTSLLMLPCASGRRPIDSQVYKGSQTILKCYKSSTRGKLCCCAEAERCFQVAQVPKAYWTKLQRKTSCKDAWGVDQLSWFLRNTESLGFARRCAVGSCLSWSGHPGPGVQKSQVREALG